MSKFTDKWKGYRFRTGTRPGADYIEFQREAKEDLKRQAQENGLTLAEFKGGRFEFEAYIEDAKGRRYQVELIGSVRDTRFGNGEPLWLRFFCKSSPDGRSTHMYEFSSWEKIGESVSRYSDELDERWRRAA